MNNSNLKWNSEIEGMRWFYEKLLENHSKRNYEIDYSCNTDGKINGTLFEFKLNFTDVFKHKEQVKRYIQALNSAAINPPSITYLIFLNEKEYIKIDNEKDIEISRGIWNDVDDFEISNTYLRGWINEFSIVSWNNRYCEEFNKKATKEEVKNEFVSPNNLYIQPFNWDEQLEKEKSNRGNNNWLTFNMNLLGNSLLKKKLGAFFTHDKYVKIATKMLRNAIKLVPEGNDYIILDRCAGTGNLEKFLTDEEQEIVNVWREILSEIKEKKEYVEDYKYGAFQIDKDINIKVDSGSKTKWNKVILKPKYERLDEKLKELKKLTSDYYETNLKAKVIEYTLLK